MINWIRRRRHVRDPWGRWVSIGTVLAAADTICDTAHEVYERFAVASMKYPDSEAYREAAREAASRMERLVEWHGRVMDDPQTYWEMPR